MKKNRTMRAATLLLALTLMTSCFVGSTFAKYVSTSEGTDTARVAYWGFDAVEPAAVEFNIFDTSDDTGLKTIAGTNLLAPGTTGSASFQFVNAKDGSEAPEVAYTVTVSTAGSSTSADIGDLNDELVWTLDGTVYTDLDTLLAAIRDMSGSTDGTGVATFAPGTAVPDILSNTAKEISWEWAFDGDDAADTALGNADPLEEITLKVTVTVEQENTYTAP